MISKVGQVMALVTACFLWGSLALAEPETPEFFGIYVKMKDGRLIELQSVVPFQYKAFNKHQGKPSLEDNDIFRALTATDRPPTYYLHGEPALALRASDIAGFFVCGDYVVKDFFITEFVPSPVNNQETILIKGSDTGPGIRNSNNFIDSNRGFSLERHFRYVEKKPKIYWIVPRENVDLGDLNGDCLAIRFSNANNYWPFSAFRDEKDYVRVAERYRKAAEQGNSTTQLTLGDMYRYGQGVVPKDYVKAVEWYRKAAERGNMYAQTNLGDMYMYGQGVPKDYAKAAEWYQKAAEQGDAFVQLLLGLRYAIGQGVPKDYAKAAEWYQKAAEQGDATAQFNLGVMYNNGQGVPKDYAKAVEWFQKAAEQNDISASHSLAWLYATREDGNFRNGPKAVAYALKATSGKIDSWMFLSTLAAAYVRNNEFDKAIEAAQRSIELLVEDATVENKEKWLQEAKYRLELYRKHEPYVYHPNKGDEIVAK